MLNSGFCGISPTVHACSLKIRHGYPESRTPDMREHYLWSYTGQNGFSPTLKATRYIFPTAEKRSS